MAGYLVGDRLVPDGVSDVTGAGAVFDLSVKVRLSPGGGSSSARSSLWAPSPSLRLSSSKEDGGSRPSRE